MRVKRNSNTANVQHMVVAVRHPCLSSRPTNTQTYKHTNQQTHKPTNTQTNKHTNQQTHKHTNQQTHKPTNTQTNKHTDQQTHRTTNTQKQQTHKPTNTNSNSIIHWYVNMPSISVSKGYCVEFRRNTVLISLEMAGIHSVGSSSRVMLVTGCVQFDTR